MSERAFSLDRHWRFRAVEPHEQADFAARQLPGELGREGWRPASVPGSVHLHLMDTGQLEDPFVATREKQAAWIESQEFVYKTNFLLPESWEKHLHAEGQRFELHFESLETFAQVYFNGEHVAESSNQFRPLTVDVTERIRQGENLIHVHFESAARRCAELEVRHGRLNATHDRTRVHARRAQFLTGWSMAPRLSGCGFWGPVNVRRIDALRFLSIAIPVKGLSTSEAKVLVETDIETTQARRVEVETVIERLDPVGSSTAHESEVVWEKRKVLELGAGRFRYSEKAVLSDPALWWPVGFGSGRRTLYRARMTARCEGEILDDVESVFGLRKVELATEKEGDHGAFVIRVNDQPVFARGAVWVPPDMVPGRIRESFVRRTLDAAAAGNINMLRVWAGGVYESEAFYRRCDELGIMVWQDFMFLQGDYPETKDFWYTVQHEARYQVRRLRNHPSLVLWCGNDGCELLHHQKGDNGARQSGRKIFSKLLSQICQTYDPQRPYWESTPHGGTDPNSERVGDHHLTAVWDDWDSEDRYRDVRARFVSRFGFMSLPDEKTIERFTSEKDKTLSHPDFQAHQKQPDGNSRLFRYIIGRTRTPENFDELVYLSQWVQSNALSLAIDSWRANKPETMGALIWHLNDCWPGVTSSLIDWQGIPKMAYWTVRNSFATTSLILLPADDGLRAVAVHDGPRWEHDLQLLCRLKGYRLNGELLHWVDRDIVLPANGKTEIGLFTYESLGIERPEECVVAGELCSGRTVLSSRLFSPVEPKSAPYGEPELVVMLDCIVGGRRAVFQIRSHNIVRGVQFALEGLPGARVRFDNAFDLWPSREVWVNVELPPMTSREKLLESVRFRCLNDLAGGRTVHWRQPGISEGEGLAIDASASGMTQLTRLRMTDIVRKLDT